MNRQREKARASVNADAKENAGPNANMKANAVATANSKAKAVPMQMRITQALTQ